MSQIDEIKERISIEELVSEYIELKRAGSSFRALCPFHAEKTPSFYVSPSRRVFKCFGCGKSGDIFTFLQEIEGIEFKEALKRLADKAGVELEHINLKEEKSNKRLISLMNSAKEFYKKELRARQDAIDYIKSRGFSDKIIEKFELGFAPDSWDSVFRYLVSLGYTQSEIELAGLIKKHESKNSYYDRFRSRIMFPIFNNKGDTVAFSGRIFNKEDGAKYINSPETPLFVKSEILFAYNFAKQNILKYDFAILSEGQADVLAFHDAGFSNAVALSGTALSKTQIALISRFSKKIILALDLDEAGLNSIIKNSKELLSLDFDVKVWKGKKGQDPADILKEYGKDALKTAIKEAKDIFEFLLDFYKDLSSEEKYVRLVSSTLVELLANIDSELKREFYAKKIANAIGVSAQSVLADAKARRASPKGESMSEKSPLADLDTSKNIKEKVAVFYKFLSGSLDKAGKAVLHSFEEDFKDFLDEIKQQSDLLDNDLLFKFEEEVYAAGGIDKAYKNFAPSAMALLAKVKIDELSTELQGAERRGDEKEAEQIQNKILELINKMKSYG